MPAAKTQVACPNCRNLVLATLEQLFDVAADPGAKNRFLSGRFNFINCPTCGYQGQVATPLLYHDPAKELLLSFVPMELGLPQPEQERVIGRLMNEVINRLPAEKRKGYLLNPKPALTLQGMIERVLEGEGITKEMVAQQRAKVQLIQTFLTAAEERLPELVKEHDAELDFTFFQLLTATVEAEAAERGQAGAQRLLTLRQRLIELSSYGAQAKRRQQIIESVARELQELGDKLTQDKLLELIIKAKDPDKEAAYVSLVRPGLDYAFFEALTKRMDKAQGAEKDRLTKLRENLLQLTQEIDQAAQAEMAEASELLRTLLEAPDLNEALRANVARIDDTFLAVLSANVEAAEKAGRSDLVRRLNAVHEAILRMLQEAAPPEIKFINELLTLKSESEAEAELKRRASEINQQVVEAMTYLIENLRQNGQAELAARLDKLRGVALGELMAANWKK